MKRRKHPLALLLAALLMLSLAACGNEAPPPAPTAAPTPQPTPTSQPTPQPTPTPEPTPQPAQEPTPAPTPTPEPTPGSLWIPNPLPAPYYLAFSMGETVRCDLDGDGIYENVCVRMAPDPQNGFQIEVDGEWRTVDTFCIEVDGEDLTAAWYAEGRHFDCPDASCWLLTDVDTTDGALEIAVQDWGPSDDLTTRFFRCGKGALTDLGTVEGFIRMDGQAKTAVPDGHGGVRSYMRLHVLQTWWTDVNYALGADGRFAVVPQAFYAANWSWPQTVETRCELLAYDAPDGQSGVLPAGTELELCGTDDAEWVLASSAADGAELWLRLEPDNGFRVEGPEGFVFSSQALDRLSMAD